MPISLAQRVLRTIRSQRMCLAGERVAVGVSGGSDSVAQLRLLTQLAPELGVRVAVVHFNHQLRGAESDGDEQFVAALAAELGLPFFAGRGDVAGAALEHGWNLEDAARRLRYAFFASLVEAREVARIAVAHTADDQAETVLARLTRGTGPAGLAAIYPVKGQIVRPLIEIRRQDLRDYLRAAGQTWREDSSNEDTRRLRARLRHSVLPMLERDVQPALVEHLGRLARMAREDEAFWAALIGHRLGQLVRRERGRLGIRCADLLAPLPWAGVTLTEEARLAVTRRLVRAIIHELRGDCRELTALHVEQVLHLASTHASGRRVALPGIQAERSFDWMWFSTTAAESAARGSRAMDLSGELANSTEFLHVVTLAAPGESSLVVVPEIRKRFHLKVIDWPRSERDTRMDQGVLDRDLLGSPLLLRNWRPGDSFRPRGRHSAHKLKRLLQAKRVAIRDRAGWPVLTSREELVWTRGLPVADEFAVRKATRTGVVIAEEEI